MELSHILVLAAALADIAQESTVKVPLTSVPVWSSSKLQKALTSIDSILESAYSTRFEQKSVQAWESVHREMRASFTTEYPDAPAPIKVCCGEPLVVPVRPERL